MSSLPSIDTEMLANVTGGKASSDEALTTALTGIQTNLKDLAAARNNPNNTGINQLVPLMFMAKLARREV